MSILRMRNKLTGEFQDVDDASVDFIRMKREVGPDGQSKWEQTGDHHVRAAMARAHAGDLRDEDLGKDYMPLPLDLPLDLSLGPELAPHRALTPGEIENGYNSIEDKQQDEQEMHLRALMGFGDENQLKSAREQADRGEGPLARHPMFARAKAHDEGRTAVLERSEVEGMEDDVDEDDDGDDTPRRRRRAAKPKSRAGGPPSDEKDDDKGQDPS